MCQKSSIRFVRHAIIRRQAAIERFIADLKYHAYNILDDVNLFDSECEEKDRNYNPICFKRSPGYACTMYFRACEYYELCQARNNPLLWRNNPPDGFEVNEWHPKDHEEKQKKLLGG